MRAKLTSFLSASALGLVLFGACPGFGRCADAPVAAGGGVAEHAAKFDFGEEWGETVDWAKLDLVTRELAPDRLDWNALCVKAAGKPIEELPNGLPPADAEKFVEAVAARLKQIAADKHVEMTQNDWAIVGCAIAPMQQVKGSGQKYVTSLGDTSRLGLAITKLTRTGVNCGDGCVLTQALLKALGIEARFVGCHRKISLPSQPAGHAMIEYFETNAQGRRFGHIVDATNMTSSVIAGEPFFRPPTARFQLVGDRLARLQFLIANPFLHEQPPLQGFDPPFTQDELASPVLADFATVRWDGRLEPRSVLLESSELEATVPEGKSIVYKITIGQDIPEGATPIARMYRKGTDGTYRSLGSFTLHRRSASKDVRLVWDRLLDGLTPGDYRADFYVDDGSYGYGFRRGGTYAGEQIIHYGTVKKATP